MRKRKQAKLAHTRFWANFCYFNLPTNTKKIPSHINRVNFRYYHANDDDLERMVEVIKSIDQLDLDETDVSEKGIEHLNKLELIKEIRLKGCHNINDQAMPFLCKLKGVELLHLKGTAITTNGFEHIAKLKNLKTLLISAEENDPLLPEIFVSLPKGCAFIVNYKAYPFVEECRIDG